MKKVFVDWFNEQQKLRPELNLAGIKKLLYSSFITGWETAFAKGFRSGYDERDKEEPEPVVVVGDVPLNPTPEMIRAGTLSLLDFDQHNPAELAMAQARAERIWRVMWAAKNG